MACTSCGTSADGKPRGCKSNGGCATGGCNKLNTFDWLSTYQFEDPMESDLVEVSFRNGTQKGFYFLQGQNQAFTGDQVVVEADGGYDIGEISLKGPLAQLQLKKKNSKRVPKIMQVLRPANERDLSKLSEVTQKNWQTMIRARAIARTLKLDMKIGDVDYRGDGKKATFYYTAEGRVDFRELIKLYANEFRVKIEMRQIGSRQESARIGGLGSCGRELCCSTWLTDFKSVTTSAARYQNLAINQAKLSGQCGRLKCCLNYELDIYLEALQGFPTNADSLSYVGGTAKLIKTDIFKRLMFYLIREERGRDQLVALSVDHVIEIQSQIKQGNIPQKISGLRIDNIDDVPELDDVTGHIELPDEVRKKKKKKPKFKNREDSNQSARGDKADKDDSIVKSPSGQTNTDQKTATRHQNNPNRSNKKRPSKSGQSSSNLSELNNDNQSKPNSGEHKPRPNNPNSSDQTKSPQEKNQVEGGKRRFNPKWKNRKPKDNQQT